MNKNNADSLHYTQKYLGTDHRPSDDVLQQSI